MLGQALNTGDPLNRSHPLARGLAGFWLGLPGLQGSRLFDYCGGNHGTFTNGPTWATGPDGFGAVSFDGADDYADVGSSPALNLTGDLWVAATVRTTSAAVKVAVGCYNPAGGSGFGLAIGVNTAGKPDFYTGSAWVGGSAAVNDGAWHRVLAGADNGTIRLFVDGVAAGSSAGSVSSAYSGGKAIGANANASNFWWAGQLTAVAVGGRAATASLAALDYDQFRRGFDGLLRRQTRRSVAFTGTSPPPPPSYFLPAVAGLGW